MRTRIYLIWIAVFSLSCSISLAQSTITFQLSDVPGNSSKQVGIRGNIEPLSWEESIVLTKIGDEFSTTIFFKQDFGEIEFKFVLFEDDSNPTWESNENRTIQLKSGSSLISKHQWDVEQLIDINALEVLQPRELLVDLELIETMIRDVHPGTYRYKSISEIEDGIDELKSFFESPRTHGEAYLAMSKLTALLECDHTKVGFNNQNKVINSIIHRQPDKLPFTFKWFGDRMFVEFDASVGKKLIRGTEVLSINQVPVSEIQSAMFPYIAADGATDQNRFYKMQVHGYDFRYNAFDVFYPLLFPNDEKNYEIQIRYPNGKSIVNIRENSVTREYRASILSERYPEFPSTRDDLWAFQIIEGNTGLLTINSFGAFGWKAMTLDWKAFLEDTFNSLNDQNIEKLIIDIRKNNGGADPMSVELFSYLNINESIANTSYREGRTRYLTFPNSLKPYVQTWGDDPWFFQMEAEKNENGYYIFPDGGSKFEKKTANIFDGEVILLTSAGNTSLAFYTAQNFKRQQLGTIIGQETGGNLRDINGGQILFLRLPNSGIEIDFPVMGGFAFGDQPNQGVQADIVIIPTIEDFISGRDIVLETALNQFKD